MKNSTLKSILAGAIAAGLSFAAPAFADGVHVKTAKGDVEFDKVPSKIAVFDVNVIENLNLLGVKPAGILKNLYVSHLDEVANSDAAKLGSFFEPDFEATHALQPDLIIVAGRSAKHLDKMSEIAKTVDMTAEWENFIGEATGSFVETAKIVGKEDQAKEIVAKLEGDIKALNAIAKDKGTGLIIMTNGPKISAYGPGSRFGWLHDAFGVPAALKDIEAATHGMAVTHEFILKTNPEWLYVIDRSAAIGRPASAATTLDNELVKQTKAWKNGNVVYLDSAALYISGSGVQTLQMAADQVKAALTK